MICLHIGSSSQVVITAMDAPIDAMITLQPMNIVQCAADLVWSPVFRKFPRLRVALSEGGIGWVPYFLERIDYVYQHHHAWTNQDFGDRLPSEVFNEHVLTCFIDDSVGMEVRHHLNLEPHPLGVRLPALGLDLAARPGDGDEVPRRPARRRHRPDHAPQRHAPTSATTRSPTSRPEQATVGALRAQATDVDTTPVSHGTGKFQDEGIVTAMTLAERIAAAHK